MARLCVLATVAVAAAAVVTACGAEDVSPRTAVAEAATKTGEAGSSLVGFSMRMEVAGEEIVLEGEGEFDYAEREGRLTYDMGSLAELGGGPPDALGDGRFEVLFEGLVFYLGFPRGSAITEELGPGKRWLKIDVERMSEATGVDLGSLMQLDQNPIDQVQLLRAASDGVEEVGREEVRGVETTRYRANVNLRRAVETALEQADVPAPDREALERQVERMQAQVGMPETIPMEVWLDGDGLPRRLVMEMAMTVEGEEIRMEMAMELYDFGVEVDVEPPPAREVVDVTDTVLEETD